jgi:hypothetical protein
MWLLMCLLYSLLFSYILFRLPSHVHSHLLSPLHCFFGFPPLSSPLSPSLSHYLLSPLPSALFLICSHPHCTPLTLTVTPALTIHDVTLAHYTRPYHARPFPCSLTTPHCPPLTQTPPTSLPTTHTNFLYPRSFGPQERGSDHGAQEVEGRVCMEQREHQANVDAC